MKKGSFLLPVLFLCVWQLVCTLGLLPPSKLTSPLQVCLGMKDLLTQGMPPGFLLPMHALYSLERVLYGFSLALLLGVPLGIAMGGSRTLRNLLYPMVNFFRPIPPLAWVPLAILWFGIGLKSAAFLIFLGAFFPILLNTCAGVLAVEPILVDAARTLDASRWNIWLKVLLPGSLPSILTGIRIGMGIGWMTLVAAELTGVRQGYGLGYMIMSAHDLQRIDEIFAGMVAIGLIGLAIEWCLARLSKSLLKWK